ncbi:MAG TPA: DUF4118 domain-containing protein [Pseudolabrys sp.]|nr:DUF4118 domain-containing protein [Pseudolabrys sp.]
MNAVRLERFRKEIPGIVMTVTMVAVFTAVLYGLVSEAGLAHGSVVFLIPVVIAATQWGVVAALIAAVFGVIASAFFFYAPLYSFRIKESQELVDLFLFLFVAIAVGQLATRLKRQLEMARRREIDLRDLYAFSRRLAMAFDVSDIHAAIEEHLASVMQRNVVLFASGREPANGGERRAGITVPDRVRNEVSQIAAGRRDTSGATITSESGETWLVRPVSPKSLEFGAIAINLGRESKERSDELRIRVDAVLADATATLERLGVAHAISEARMRARTDELREALIGSVSHELRTPLASILGAATVLSAAPALKGEEKLTALVHDVRDEAERLNNDIQNLLDATRISSDGVKPHPEWADPADIINSALDRCRSRLADRNLAIDVPHDLPLIHVDPVMVQQALVQIFDNAVKYSPPRSRISIRARTKEDRLVISIDDEGAGLTSLESTKIWERFARGERHAATTSGSGLGLWIASAFISANEGNMQARSGGPGQGTTIAIELPVAQAALTHMESGVDE